MAALPPPPGAAVAAFDVVAWAQALALGPEDTNADAGSTVYLVTCAFRQLSGKTRSKIGRPQSSVLLELCCKASLSKLSLDRVCSYRGQNV